MWYAIVLLADCLTRVLIYFLLPVSGNINFEAPVVFYVVVFAKEIRGSSGCDALSFVLCAYTG